MSYQQGYPPPGTAAPAYPPPGTAAPAYVAPPPPAYSQNQQYPPAAAGDTTTRGHGHGSDGFLKPEKKKQEAVLVRSS